MDQTTFATARLLWSFGERGALPDLVRHLRLPAGGDSQKAIETQSDFERNSANLQR
jgi:hypothetical protein